MKPSRLNLLVLWLAFALAALPALRAQNETPPAPPAPPAEEKQTAPAEKQPAEETPEEPETPAEPSTETEEMESPKAEETDEKAVESAKESEMRELGEPTTKKTTTKKSGTRVRRTRSHDAEPKMGDQIVTKDAIQTEAVTIVGNTTVDGHVRDVAVSIVGNTIVNGRVDGEAVAVMGSVTVNGRVGGEVVAVFGDINLGPDAFVGGEAIAVFGKVNRAEGAEVRGGIQQIGGFGHLGDFTWLRAWIEKCLLRGRLLGFGEGLGWAWAIAGGFLVFYMLLALIFPRGVERCAEVLEQRPGKTLLAALLTMIIAPIVAILLAFTGIGLALMPVFFLAGLFGKAAILAWFGRRVVVGVQDGFVRHPVMCVLIGGVIVALLYVIPILGFMIRALLGVLGLGMVVYALIVAGNRPKPVVATAGVPPVLPVPPGSYVPPSATMSGMVAPSVATEADALRDASGGVVPPPQYATPPQYTAQPIISAATLPRAGFWIRVAAAALDLVMVAIIVGLIDGMFGSHIGAGFMLWIAVYCVAMWTKKGTTIGGVICGLKVVRLDDRPLDWGVSIVRAMSAFLSLAVAGLGFIWVAFDDDKQSWHDKIAGTTIVRVPKGTALL